MEKGPWPILILLLVNHIKDNGKMEKFMELASSSGEMVQAMKDSISWEKSKVMAYLLLKIIIFIKDIGWMVWGMGEEFSTMKGSKSLKLEYGEMGSYKLSF